MIIGHAIYKNNPDTPNYENAKPWIGFYDGITQHVGIHCSGVDIIAYRNTTYLGTSSGSGWTFGNYVWYYVEVKVTIDDSVGVIQVKVNGNNVINLTNQDTRNGANAVINKIRFAAPGNNQAYWHDDLYILDTTGTKNNDFLGDIRVDVLRPDGAGTYTDFTPSTGSNYENVDESPGPDDDTTYNEATNIGDQDSYNLDALPSPSGTTIHGVKSQITARKTDAGTREIKVLTRSGTTDDLGNAISLSDTYTTPCKVLEDNPDDSLAWEDADVNALEVGVEITA